MADNDPINPINNLKVTADYSELTSTLLDINANVSDTQNDLVFDYNGQSQLVNIRKALKSVFKSKVVHKEEKIGVVLAVGEELNPDTGQINKVIYVDVPNSTTPRVINPEDFSGPNVDLGRYADIAFYPISETVLQQEYPSFMDLVRVRTGITRSENKYLGLFAKKQLLRPTYNRTNTIQASKDLQLQIQKFRKSIFKRAPKAISPDDLIEMPIFPNATDENGNPAYEVSSIPALRIHPKQKVIKDHEGIDFPLLNVPRRDVIAPSRIQVLYAEFFEKSGNTIVAQSLDNPKFIFKFLHLKDLNRITEKNQIFQKGDIIGIGDTTGTSSVGYHLHFEIWEKTENDKLKLLNPIFLLKGKTFLRQGVVEAYGFASPYINFPIPLKIEEAADLFAPINRIDSGTPQQKITATITKGNTSAIATASSNPVNRPKMALLEVEADFSRGVRLDKNLGSKTIKIREDIKPDYSSVKDILNKYNIPLTCTAQDIKIKNDNLSLLAKVGLEVLLNKNAALTNQNDLDVDDYFISPDYNHPIGNGYKLIVYGNVKKNVNYFDEKYKPEKKIIDVYDGKQLSPNGPPKIKKIFKTVLNISKIFEDYGFKQVLPHQEFFLYSNIEKSNWFRFQNPSKIIVGYSYKELLSTVYENNGEPIWLLPELVWDGNKFV